MHDADAAALKRFGELLHDTFDTNLAATAKLTASNVRGHDAAYDPQQLLDDDRYTYWSTDDEVKTPELVIDFGAEQTFSVIRLRENIKLGQRIEAFALDAWRTSDNAWHEFAAGTSIGPARLVRLDVPQTTSKVRLRITRSPVAPALSDFGIFAEPAEAQPTP